MTGLDTEKDHIMEMACIVTDKHLNILAEGPNLVIHQVGEVWRASVSSIMSNLSSCRTSVRVPFRITV